MIIVRNRIVRKNGMGVCEVQTTVSGGWEVGGGGIKKKYNLVGVARGLGCPRE